MASVIANNPEPEAAWRAVLKRDPFDAVALQGLGRVMLRRKRSAEAIALFAAAAEDSNDPDLLTSLAAVLVDIGRIEEAEPYLRRALADQPQNFAVLFDLGKALLLRGQSWDALCHLRHALRLAPDRTDIVLAMAGALIAQGNAAYAGGDMRQAEHLYREAIGLGVDLEAAYNNLANALTGQLRLSEALEAYRAALSVNPEADTAGFAYSLCLLLSGDEEQGRHHFERRRRVETLRRDHERRPELPQWHPGISLTGKRVLLTAEQGSGDLIQYARFAPVVAQSAASVVLEMPWPLINLFQTLPGIERIVGLDDTVLDCDIACPLLSLPLLLGQANGVPPPYITAPPARIPRWAAWLGRSGPGRRIGLVCSGDQRHPRDRERSIALSVFAPLLELPGLTFVLPQTEIRDTDRVAFEAADNLRCPAAALTDYADTAALLSGLELLITVDTSAAHLAGAMGLPVWTLLTYAPDYRWGIGRDDSPWYPSIRLFRQEQPDQWEPVIQRVCEALR